MSKIPENARPRAARERAHRGDIMAPETRSRVMSRIRGRDTGPERVVARLLAEADLMAEAQARDLPGRPDFVLRDLKVAIFVDGAFWHGWKFEDWRHKLSEHWEDKIAATRRRDRRNHVALRRSGWAVIRIWDFQIEENAGRCLSRMLRAVRQRRKNLASESPVD